jgi:hypothetical protein
VVTLDGVVQDAFETTLHHHIAQVHHADSGRNLYLLTRIKQPGDRGSS